MKQRRVEKAGQMDIKFAELASLHAEYETLGKQLQGFPGLDLAQGGMARWEECIGTKRLAGAAPVFLTKLGMAPDQSQRVPLAISEARFWSLPPPEQPAAKAA